MSPDGVSALAGDDPFRRLGSLHEIIGAGSRLMLDGPGALLGSRFTVGEARRRGGEVESRQGHAG
jgi:hypothetical protein